MDNLELTKLLVIYPAKAKQAYIQSSRKVEWLAYFNRLKTTYARRPSLQKELAKL